VTDGRHGLAEERSLAYHRVVAERLRSDPRLVEGARARVEGWMRDGKVAERWCRDWLAVLERPVDAVAALLVDPGESARALRQSSPFAGALDARTRWTIWRRVNEQARSA